MLRKPLIRRDKGDTLSLLVYKSYLSPEHLVLPPLLPCCFLDYPGCVCVCVYLLNCTWPRNKALSSLSFYATCIDQSVCVCLFFTLLTDWTSTNSRFVANPIRGLQDRKRSEEHLLTLALNSDFSLNYRIAISILYPRRRDAVQATAVLGVLAVEFSHESMSLHDID